MSMEELLQSKEMTESRVTILPKVVNEQCDNRFCVKTYEYLKSGEHL